MSDTPPELIAESVRVDKDFRPGWTTWIPFNLMECQRCSALVLNYPAAMENHEHWHAQIDGSPGGPVTGVTAPEPLGYGQGAPGLPGTHIDGGAGDGH